MIARSLLKQFEFNQKTLDINLEGITQEDSLRQPHPGGNCINWIVGHVLAGRNSIHRLLGLPPAWVSEPAARYARGTNPVTGAEDARPLDEMVDRLRASAAAITAALGSIAENRLSETSGGDDPAGVQLAFLSFHESYHAGQIGLLRRLSGRTGAIR